MKNRFFAPVDILIPIGVSFEKWSVIACDQFTSEPEYWQRVQALVGDSESTLNLIIPEAFLGEVDQDSSAENIYNVMASYLERNMFEEYKESFVFVKRVLPGGKARFGLVGAVDLEYYDFREDSKPLIRASEKTVVSRLPARIAVREKAQIELPHIMALINDKNSRFFAEINKLAQSCEAVYDFDLMENGGSIQGRVLSGENAEKGMMALDTALERQEIKVVIGDGNHSLAAAKVYWDELKKTLSEQECVHHPARFALLELNCVYDEAIEFHAINRVVFCREFDALQNELREKLKSGGDYHISWMSQEGEGVIGISAACIGDMLDEFQGILDGFEEKTGCEIDYIHGDDAVRALVKQRGGIGFILPPMDKKDLFETVALRGVFPKKSFSIGHAHEKRYYLECRKIR